MVVVHYRSHFLPGIWFPPSSDLLFPPIIRSGILFWFPVNLILARSIVKNGRMRAEDVGPKCGWQVGWTNFQYKKFQFVFFSNKKGWLITPHFWGRPEFFFTFFFRIDTPKNHAKEMKPEGECSQTPWIFWLSIHTSHFGCV